MRMVISRTPYRVSLFGGGTDYHTWYQTHGSIILASSINHYCYITCRPLPPFFEHRSRIAWSILEKVNHPDEIEHPVVRATLNYLKITQGIEIHHQGDLPARSGLGSSSAFTVGLVNGLYAMQGSMSTKKQLASEAVYIERQLLKESVGVQDQIQTAYGGLNKITVTRNGEFYVEPLILPADRVHQLEKNLLLFFTGTVRHASTIASQKMQNMSQKEKVMERMQSIVQEAIDALVHDAPLSTIGNLLHESWLLKKSLADSVAPPLVDSIYDRAIQAGALGGKLLGAGGGGFMLFFVEPDKHAAVLDALSDLLWVPFQFEYAGSQIIFSDETVYGASAMTRRDFVHLQRRANVAYNQNEPETEIAGD